MRINKNLYYKITFVLSIYLLFSVSVDYINFSQEFKEINHIVTIFVLWFFVFELLVLFYLEKSKKKFFKEHWISIIAVFSSVSIIHISQFFAWAGVIFGIDALKSMKILKSVKGIKAFKAFKLAKGAKLVKTVKIGKKAYKKKENKNVL